MTLVSNTEPDYLLSLLSSLPHSVKQLNWCLGKVTVVEIGQRCPEPPCPAHCASLGSSMGRGFRSEGRHVFAQKPDRH